jgi:adenosylcobinamide-GDP ribazoletransferase
VLAIGAMTLVTGALHEDGLADAVDGLGARGGPEARLAAMRDSHVGTFGVLALVLVSVGRIAAVAGIDDGWLTIGALVGAGAVSRALLAPIMQAVPPARSDGLAAGAGRPTANGATLAAVIAIALAVVCTGPMTAIVGLISAGLAAYMVAALARRTLGGTTGDVLGAAQQVSDVVFLMAVSAIA